MNLPLREQIRIIQNTLRQIDQDWSDFVNASREIEISPPTQMQIDDAVIYVQKNLNYDKSMNNLFEQYDKKRRMVLGYFPELKPYLDEIMSTNRELERFITRGLQIDNEQVSLTFQAQQAFHSENAPLWNSSMQRLNDLKPEYNYCKSKYVEITTKQSLTMSQAKEILKMNWMYCRIQHLKKLLRPQKNSCLNQNIYQVVTEPIVVNLYEILLMI